MKDTDRFFKSIKFEDSNKDFKDTSIEKVVINKQTEKFIVYLNIKDILKKDIIDSLFAALKNKINGLKEVDVKINYLNKNSEAILEYFKILFSELLEKRPSLIGLLDSKISMDNNIITVEVSNKIEELEVEKEIDNFLNRFYSSSSFINNNSYIKLSFLNPLELSELIAAFSDNNTLFDIDMWISLDKDVFIKISPLNADIIIKYIFERYPY